MNIITISPEAWTKVHEKLVLTDSKSVRIGVKTVGCNGHSYTFNVSKESPQDTESYLQENNHYVIIEPGTEKYFKGSELKWDGDDVFSKHFVFANPNALSECGCGESVNFKPELLNS